MRWRRTSRIFSERIVKAANDTAPDLAAVRQSTVVTHPEILAYGGVCGWFLHSAQRENLQIGRVQTKKKMQVWNVESQSGTTFLTGLRLHVSKVHVCSRERCRLWELTGVVLRPLQPVSAGRKRLRQIQVH